MKNNKNNEEEKNKMNPIRTCFNYPMLLQQQT